MPESCSNLLQCGKQETTDTEHSSLLRNDHAQDPRSAPRSLRRTDLIIDRPESNDSYGVLRGSNRNERQRETYPVARLFARDIDEPRRILLAVRPLLPAKDAHLLKQLRMGGELLDPGINQQGGHVVGP